MVELQVTRRIKRLDCQDHGEQTMFKVSLLESDRHYRCPICNAPMAVDVEVISGEEIVGLEAACTDCGKLFPPSGLAGGVCINCELADPALREALWGPLGD